MELRQLRSFVVLADELHFKKAADKLFIVQPALTKQIQDLERELGVLLFERNKRKVQLSVAGEFFREKILLIINELEVVKNKVKLIENGLKGEVRIGYVGSCIHTFLPKLLSELHEQQPQIQTYLSEMTTASQLRALQKGELDIAFVRNPPPNKHLAQRLIFRETFSLILPQNHALDETQFRNMAQLADEAFILPTQNDGDLYQKLQWSICEEAGFTPKIAHETVHGYTTIKLVENGLGISIIPTSFKTVTHAAIKFIELKNIWQKPEITATWNLQNLNPSLKYLLKLVGE